MSKQFFCAKNLIKFMFMIVLILPIISLYGCTKNTQGSQMATPLEVGLARTTLASQVSTTEVAPSATSAVVGILANLSGGKSIGTGFAIAPNYIVSNDHVVGDTKNVTLYLKDGTNTKGSVIWRDNALDLSVIKIDSPLPYLEIEETSPVVGEDVIAIGTPIDVQFQHTVTKGIVSATGRTVAVDTDYGESYLQDLIQHDASINPGNSGGPLINAAGKVVGINTLKVNSAEGLGFAIPPKAAKNVVKHLREDGAYTTPYMGVYGVDKMVSKYYGKDISQNGVVINNIAPQGPAAVAGLKLGDVITRIGNQEINNMLDLRSELYNHKVGDQISVTYSRNGSTYSTTITLEKHPQY